MRNNGMKKLGLWGMTAIVLAVLVFHVTTASETSAQSGSRSGSGSRARGGQSFGRPLSFEEKLWNYLKNVHYTNWAPAQGQNGGYYPGESPHGAFLKMYLNRTAAGEPKTLPYGSMIIKENYAPDQQTLMAVTVMYRSKGYDAEHFDWYWVKYNPDGSVARTPPEKGSAMIAGRFKSCIECHSGANGDDFVFAND